MDIKGKIQSNLIPEQRVDTTKVVQSIIANQIALDFMRDIQGTQFFVKTLKQKVKMAQAELEKAEIHHFENLFLENEEFAASEVFVKQREMVKEIAALGIMHFENITHMVRAYKKDPSSIQGIVNKINR